MIRDHRECKWPHTLVSMYVATMVKKDVMADIKKSTSNETPGVESACMDGDNLDKKPAKVIERNNRAAFWMNCLEGMNILE